MLQSVFFFNFFPKFLLLRMHTKIVSNYFFILLRIKSLVVVELPPCTASQPVSTSSIIYSCIHLQTNEIYSFIHSLIHLFIEIWRIVFFLYSKLFLIHLHWNSWHIRSLCEKRNKTGLYKFRSKNCKNSLANFCVV